MIHINEKTSQLTTSQIVLYQPDENISLEVKLEQDTVWLTQAQMVELFQTSKQNVSLHIGNIFKEGELQSELVVKESLTTTPHGAIPGKNQRKKVKLYNLDVIISLGYRVKSIRGTQFRIWATNVLRDHLLKGYSVNHQLVALQERVDDRFSAIEQTLQKHEEQISFFIRTNEQPTYQLYNNGCVFDAWTYVSDLIRKATERIILIDNYVDDRVLAIMDKRQPTVTCTIHTRYTEQFQTDLQKHNEQYPEIRYVQLPQRKHDRYLIIDQTVYMLGDSLKNMGSSLTAIIRTEMTPQEILSKLG